MIILTPNANYMFVGRDDSRTDCAVVRETWVENVYRIESKDLDDTGVFVDIGANIGAVSIFAATLVYGATVLAVEPEHHNLELLHKNIEDNGIDNVRVAPVAVSRYMGQAFIKDEHGDSGIRRSYDDSVPESGESVVEVVTLSRLLHDYKLTYIDVLKMDVEGAEYDIIKGADRDTLAKIRYITMEFDAANDIRFGGLVAKLAKQFSIEIVGSPERGGYLFARRYDD